jgi:hypothetical protein
MVENRMTLPIPDLHLFRPRQAKPGNDKLLIRAEVADLSFVDRPCPKCSFNHPRRLSRITWMERLVMPTFGLYPWECPLCRIHFYRKNRRDREERISVQPPTEFASQEITH